MEQTKINKAIWEKKEGSIKLSLFKNKSKKGKKYVMWSICVYRFPFQYTKKIAFTDTEAKHLFNLMEERPVVKVQQTPFKKVKVKEEPEDIEPEKENEDEDN